MRDNTRGADADDPAEFTVEVAVWDTQLVGEFGDRQRRILGEARDRRVGEPSTIPSTVDPVGLCVRALP